MCFARDASLLHACERFLVMRTDSFLGDIAVLPNRRLSDRQDAYFHSTRAFIPRRIAPSFLKAEGSRNQNMIHTCFDRNALTCIIGGHLVYRSDFDCRGIFVGQAFW